MLILIYGSDIDKTERFTPWCWNDKLHKMGVACNSDSHIAILKMNPIVLQNIEFFQALIW